MEKNFNTDNFEHLLREATDDFRMYPSKRVWHGIYNDLHPAKRWPSLAILLLLVTSIMYIGVTNPDKGGQSLAIRSSDPNQLPPQRTTPEGNLQSGRGQSDLTVSTNRNQLPSDAQKTNSPLYIASNRNDIEVTPDEGNTTVTSKMTVAQEGDIARKQTRTDDGLLKDHSAISLASQTQNSSYKVPGKSTEQPSAFTTAPIVNDDNMVSKIIRPKTTIAPINIPLATTPTSTSKTTSTAAANQTDESGWMEDYAFRNMKSRDKWKGRMAYQVYVTPSIGYRTLSKTTDYTLPPANALVANPYAPSTTNYALNHSSAINLEIGGGMIYSASKSLRLKVGLQLNYTNYSVNAQELNHPTFTALMLTNSFTNTPVLSTRSTTLANTAGPTSKYLNNSTYQVSIPLGADLKIAGNDKLSVYLGATVQPTYILGGQSYLISSDMKNYVADEDFLQKYNLNGSVETFISYKTRSGVTINAGPQFRYQFFSTYKKIYTYEEKLYNLGVKLGMTKNF